MRFAVVLLLAATAGAQDLGDIAARVAAREEATYPFVAKYRIGEEVIATYATRRFRRTWRTDGEVWLRYDEWWLHTRHEPDASYTKWRGTMDRIIHFERRPVPADLGLEHELRPISTYLGYASARVLRRERLDEFDCTVVLLDWLQEASTTVLHPMGVWLADAHDAYPVLVVVYQPDPDPDREDAGRIRLEGGAFVPRVRYRTQELRRVGDVWFPARGTVERDGEVRPLVVDTEGVKLGDAVTDDDFDPPSFMWIRDRARGSARWFTPLGSVPFSFLWVVWYIANVVCAVWLLRFLRRKFGKR